MNGASPLPRKDFLPYLLPQLADRMYNLSSTHRFRPMLLKIRCFPRTKQICRAKPPYERLEIGEQFDRFDVWDWSGVQKVQRQMIAQEQKSVFPVCGLFFLRLHSFCFVSKVTHQLGIILSVKAKPNTMGYI